MSFFSQTRFYVNVSSGVMQIHLGPVVQSIVSLTSSLKGQLDKCYENSLPNTHIFFVEKMREASHIFSIKNIGVFQILTFEQLDHGEDQLNSFSTIYQYPKL